MPPKGSSNLEVRRQVLAEAGLIGGNYEKLVEGLGKVLKPEEAAALAGGVATSATIAGVAGSIVSLACSAVLIACKAKHAKQEQQKEARDREVHDEVTRCLQAIQRQVQMVLLATQAKAGSSDPEQLQKAVKEAISEAAVEFNKQALQELAEQQSWSADFVNEVRTHLSLNSAEMIGLSNKIELIFQDVQHRPFLKLPRPEPDSQSVYLYTDLQIPFVGRDQEMAMLEEFLADERRAFQWWRVIAAGGSGKSRLALELCWRKFLDGWTVGFLEPTDPDVWDKWRVERDTLIVVDYTIAKWDPYKVAEIIFHLAGQAGPQRVRLLVLERSDAGPWWESFMSSGGGQRAQKVKNSSYRSGESSEQGEGIGEPLPLPALGDSAIRSIIGYVLGREVGADSWEVSEFKRIDPLGRPLFAAFYADALHRNPRRNEWSLGDLAEEILRHKILENHGASGVVLDPGHVNLLVLATLVGGISYGVEDKSEGHQEEQVTWAMVRDREDLKEFLPARWDSDQIARLASYSDPGDTFLPALQPDPLGEALVLNRLGEKPILVRGENRVDANAAADALLAVAADLAPHYSSAWIKRAFQDFEVECTRLAPALRGRQREATWLDIPSDVELWRGLSSLDMSSSKISDLSQLRHLSALQKLHLYDNPISDLEPLQNMTALRELILSETYVSDLEPLRNMTALQALWLGYTAVSDLRPLQGLTALEQLHLDVTSVSDLEPLRNMTALQALWLGYTAVSDLEPLRNMTALRQLYLNKTTVSNLEPLRGMTALEELHLIGTFVTDLEPLRGVTSLRRLRLGGTPVIDFSPLDGHRDVTIWFPNGDVKYIP